MAFGGLDLIDHIISLMKENLPSSIQVSKVWEEMEVGFGNDNFEAVYINYITENPRPFSLMYYDEAENPAHDWFHTIHLNIDVWTGTSEVRCRELTRDVVKVIKDNILVPGNPSGSIFMKIGTISSRNSEYRNMWRMEVPVEVRAFNP